VGAVVGDEKEGECLRLVMYRLEATSLARSDDWRESKEVGERATKTVKTDVARREACRTCG